jgi:hypothetical protein
LKRHDSKSCEPLWLRGFESPPLRFGTPRRVDASRGPRRSGSGGRRWAIEPRVLAGRGDICDAEILGEVPERPKGHAWRACVPTKYRGFESLPLRLPDPSRVPRSAVPDPPTAARRSCIRRPRHARLPTRPETWSRVALLHVSWWADTLALRPAGVGRWRLGPAQEGVANPVRSGRKQRYRMSSCAAGRPSRHRRTPVGPPPNR